MGSNKLLFGKNKFIYLSKFHSKKRRRRLNRNKYKSGGGAGTSRDKLVGRAYFEASLILNKSMAEFVVLLCLNVRTRPYDQYHSCL